MGEISWLEFTQVGYSLKFSMKAILTNLFCGWVCFCLIFHPAIVLADGPNPTPLEKGQTAPFNGVLIPTLKAAEMTVRLEQADGFCAAKLDSAVASAVNQKQLLLNNCLDSKKIIGNMHTEQILYQRDYIKFLENEAVAPKMSKEWVFIIGVVAGVGLTLGAGYAMIEVGR